MEATAVTPVTATTPGTVASHAMEDGPVPATCDSLVSYDSVLREFAYRHPALYQTDGLGDR